MKVVEPPANLVVGPRRDDLVEKEAAKFETSEFFLDKTAARDRGARASKVKTFKAGNIPWAQGNGNVIAPPKPEPKVYKKIIGHRVPEDKLDKFYHGASLQRERDAQAGMMEHARSYSDNFSPQPPDRLHKVLPQVLEPPEHMRGEPVIGFKGLGVTSPVYKVGKCMVPESTYDPLGMRSWGPRITGLKRLPMSNFCTLEDGTLCHNDGVPFEAHVKKEFPRAHRHQFPQNFGPDQDMQGFRGMGVSDVPPPVHGRKHTPRTWLDHASQPPRSTSSMEAPPHHLAPLDSPSRPQLRSVSSLAAPFPPGQGVVLYHPVLH